jgi:hypothetical protein
MSTGRPPPGTIPTLTEVVAWPGVGRGRAAPGTGGHAAPAESGAAGGRASDREADRIRAGRRVVGDRCQGAAVDERYTGACTRRCVDDANECRDCRSSRDDDPGDGDRAEPCVERIDADRHRPDARARVATGRDDGARSRSAICVVDHRGRDPSRGGDFFRRRTAFVGGHGAASGSRVVGCSTFARCRPFIRCWLVFSCCHFVGSDSFARPDPSGVDDLSIRCGFSSCSNAVVCRGSLIGRDSFVVRPFVASRGDHIGRGAGIGHRHALDPQFPRPRRRRRPMRRRPVRTLVRGARAVAGSPTPAQGATAPATASVASAGPDRAASSSTPSSAASGAGRTPPTRPDPPATATVTKTGATPAAADVQLTQRVLADLQRQVELMLEVRLREVLAPILARATDVVVRDARKELTAAMREIVAKAIERELGRREDH